MSQRKQARSCLHLCNTILPPLHDLLMGIWSYILEADVNALNSAINTVELTFHPKKPGAFWKQPKTRVQVVVDAENFALTQRTFPLHHMARLSKPNFTTLQPKRGGVAEGLVNGLKPPPPPRAVTRGRGKW